MFRREPLPLLEARKLLPTPYLANVEDRSKVPSLVMDSLLPSVASTSQAFLPPLQPTVSKDGKLLTKREIGQVSFHSPSNSVNQPDGTFILHYSSVAKKKDQDTSIYLSRMQQTSPGYRENMRLYASEMHWILNGSIEGKPRRRVCRSK